MERQYIGARYVTKFWDNGSGSTEWVPNIPYESLVVVTYMNNSYTSKVPVPATNIAPNVDTEHWALTGAYNAQVEQYRQDVEGLIDNMSVVNACYPPNGYIAVSENNEDNSNALQSLLNNFGVVYLPNGNYKMRNTISVNRESILFGQGTIVREAGNRYGDIIFVEDCNFTVYGITFNDNGSTLPIFNSNDYDTDERYACIYCLRGGVDVHKCKFTNVYTRAVMCYSNNNMIVCENIMDTNARNQGYVGEFVHIQSCAGTLSICNNKMICPDYTDSKFGMCGIYVAGFNYGAGIILDNIMGTVGRDNTFDHRLLPIDFYEDVHNVTVRGNNIKSAHGFIRMHGCDNITLENNVVKKESDYMHAGGDPGIFIYTHNGLAINTKNIKVSNNYIDMNGTQSIFGISGPNLENIVIENNIIKISHGDTGTDYFAIKDNASNVTIRNNTIYTEGNNGHSAVHIFGNYNKITIDNNNVKNVQLLYLVENNGVGENIVITDNYFDAINPTPINCTINNSIVRGNAFISGNVTVNGSNTIVTENIINPNYVYNGNAIAVNNVRNGELYPPQG